MSKLSVSQLEAQAAAEDFAQLPQMYQDNILEDRDGVPVLEQMVDRVANEIYSVVYWEEIEPYTDADGKKIDAETLCRWAAWMENWADLALEEYDEVAGAINIIKGMDGSLAVLNRRDR